jgi:anti-sigma factor RsiW
MNIQVNTECHEIVARLWPHLDGALPEAERERVLKHLLACKACKSHFDFAQAFLDAVHAARPTAASSDALRHRVLAALANEGFAA